MATKRAFKIMTPKEIAHVVEVIREMYCEENGGGRANQNKITAETISKPSAEDAAHILRHVCQWVYEVDFPKKKAQIEHMDIHEEALDVVFVFTCSRQLALISGIDDFVWKDIWEPNPKRLRPILSGLINFCRYKDKQMQILEPLEETYQLLDNDRLKLARKCDELFQECIIKQRAVEQQLPAMWEAQKAALQAQENLERVREEREALEKISQDKENELQAKTEHNEELQRRVAQLREDMRNLQEQIAESPHAIQQDIQELSFEEREKKDWVEEKLGERRARAQRDQVLARVQRNLDIYREALIKNAEVKERLDNVVEKNRRARKDKENIKQLRESKEAECVDVQERVQQVEAEIERNSAWYHENWKQQEERRAQAVERQKEHQAKRSVEQREMVALQAQVSELEAEIHSLQRQQDGQVAELVSQRRAVLDDRAAYTLSYVTMLQQYDAEGSFPVQTDALHKQHNVRSPSPAPRALRSPVDWRRRSPCERPAVRPMQLLRSPGA